MKTKTVHSGVVAELDGKFWGVQSASGGSTEYGFGHIANATISDPKYCHKPTDMTWNPENCYNPWFKELKKARLVFVTVTTKYETQDAAQK